MSNTIDSAPLVRLDDRGRVTIGKQVAKRGLPPAPWYALSFGINGTLILTPATITTETTVTAA